MNHSRWTLILIVVAIFLAGWGIDQALAEIAPTKEPGKIVGVVDRNGQPVANAQVRLIKPQGAPATQPAAGRRGGAAGIRGARGARGGGVAQLAPIAQTTTDAQGHFSFHDIEPGMYGVLAGGRGQGIGRQRVAVRPGQMEDVKIDLQQIGRGAGRGGRRGATTQSAG